MVKHMKRLRNKFALCFRKWLHLRLVSISCGKGTFLTSSVQGVNHIRSPQVCENISPPLEKSGLRYRRKCRKKRSVELIPSSKNLYLTSDGERSIIKANFTPEEAMKAQKGSRGIALLFL
jgi:hypothetical protein